MKGFRTSQSAFTLVEMALVLLIIGLLTKTVVGPLAALQEHGKRHAAQQQLLVVREAVFAYLVAYGALPCPLTRVASTLVPASAVNDPGGNNQRTSCQSATGFVPARQLRLAGPLSDGGALLDPWGRRLLFAVSLSDAVDTGRANLPDWTTTGEAAQVGIANLSADLILCNDSARGNCAGRAVRADQIAFVLLSTGGDDSAKGMQAENLDDDHYFVVAEESIVEENPFDDLVAWGSAADVMYWMLRMGWLP